MCFKRKQDPRRIRRLTPPPLGHVPGGFSYAATFQTGTDQNAAQNAGSASRNNENGPIWGRFSMPFCYEALSASLSRFSGWRYKHSSRGIFARPGRRGDVVDIPMGILRPGLPGFSGRYRYFCIDMDVSIYFSRFSRDFFRGSASPETWKIHNGPHSR